jgi:hypothetical protein
MDARGPEGMLRALQRRSSPDRFPGARSLSKVARAGLDRLDETHRRTVVRLVFIVYFLAIFEGVLRKWIFPHWGKPLFFIRDPFVLAIYVLVFTRKTRLPKGFLELGYWFSFAGLILIFAQRMWAKGDPLPLVLEGYGWRNYFFFLPLAFIIGRYLDMEDLKRLLNATLLISVGMAALAFVQFASPPLAPINAGLGDTPEELYRNQGLPGGFVRPFGTFTSSVGMTVFTVSAIAMAISFWLAAERSRSLKFYVLRVSAVVGPLACLALSGSRGAIVESALLFILTIGGLALTSGGAGVKAMALIAGLTVFSAVTAPVLFPNSTKAFMQRWSDAGEGEQQLYGSGGIFGRAVYELFNFRFLFPETPPQGFGIGSAGNAAWNLGTRDKVITFTSADQISAAESDWGRNVLELGPIFGCLFILFRIAFVFWLAKRTLTATVRSGHPLPWLLFGFVGVVLLNGQITANGTMNIYAWLFTGFCLASVNSVRLPSLGLRAGYAREWRDPRPRSPNRTAVPVI